MEILDLENVVPTDLKPCGICGRTFRPDALSRHQKVCEKNTAKKRKVFDSSKQRAPEEAAQVAKKSPQPAKQTPQSKAKENSNSKAANQKPKTNWREKHEELIETVKRARGKNGVEVKNKIPSDYVQCPSCERHFNQRAAERHIPWCQKKKSVTPKSPVTDEKKEKLIARVKYRPPQGKSRVMRRKTKTADSGKPAEVVKRPTNGDEVAQALRVKVTRSSPPNLLDNRRNNSLDRVNNNVVNQQHVRRRSGSRSREKESTTSTPEIPLSIIKFKERFPNRIKRSGDLEESLTSEQLRELLRCSRNERCPRTVPGVRLFGGGFQNNRDRNDNWTYRATDVSRSASSSGASTNSWNKGFAGRQTLPDVSSSELPGTTWTGGKICWNNSDLDHSMNSTGSSGGSSSSGGSLPPLSRESNDDGGPPSVYCHQCNSKFPLVAAKYCCECGAKRRGVSPVCINQTG